MLYCHPFKIGAAATMSNTRTELNIELNPSESSSNFRDISTINKEREKAKELLKNEDKLNDEDLIKLAITLMENSEHEKADELFKRLSSSNINDGPTQLCIYAERTYGLANNKRESSHDQEAIKGYKAALSSLEQAKKMGLDNIRYHDLYYRIDKDLGIAYLKIENFLEAATIFERAVNTAKAIGKTGGIPSVLSYCGLAKVRSLASKEIIQDGFAKLHEARALYPEDVHETSLDRASNFYHMGLAYETIKEYEKAYNEYKTALHLRLKIIEKGNQGEKYKHSRVGDVYFALGRVCHELKFPKLAKEYLLEAKNSFTFLKSEKNLKEVNELLLIVANTPSLTQVGQYQSISDKDLQSSKNLENENRPKI